MRAPRRSDPHWIVARRTGACLRCYRAIPRGTRAYYYPIDRALLCDSPDCAGAAEADFRAHQQDDENNRCL